MSKIIQLQNRLKRIQQSIPKKGVDHPVYIISNGHIQYNYGNKYKSDSNICVLCGKKADKPSSYSPPCEKRLSDEQLHEFMKDKQEYFVLHIYHETVDPDDKNRTKCLKLDTDIGAEYTDFADITDYILPGDNNDVSVKIYYHGFDEESIRNRFKEIREQSPFLD